mmetsp:Transcript_13152/g.31146  ORF Transcript_13152/g.31146 Transcript_13152/m.31146 type:complete len:121 (+) Transcript_13152:5840-6202(+)
MVVCDVSDWCSVVAEHLEFEFCLEDRRLDCKSVEVGHHLCFQDKRQTEQGVEWEVLREANLQGVVCISSVLEGDPVVNDVSDLYFSFDASDVDWFFSEVLQFCDSFDKLGEAFCDLQMIR